ncbi:MAG: ATP synthase subunit I [Gammaproteobacteria bacterium]|nr:ATP synthase subunit I [Gammaproteobacteria bacterium]
MKVYLTRQIQIELLMTVLVAGYFAMQESDMALSALCGGLLPIGATVISNHCQQRSRYVAATVNASLTLLYRCAGYRFIWAIIFFAVAFGWLKLSAIPLFSGLIAAQIVPFFLIKNE